jgi:hypothetical protein
MFDPRIFEEQLLKRNEESRESAKQFEQDLAAGRLDPTSEGFNQGLFDLAPAPPAPKAKAAPEGDDAEMGE